jgi:hypothetical protein
MNKIDYFKKIILYIGDVRADIDQLHQKNSLSEFSCIAIEMTILYSCSIPGEGNRGSRACRQGRTRDTLCYATRRGRAELFAHFLAAWVVRAAGVPITQRSLNHVSCATAPRINLREQTPGCQVEASCRTRRGDRVSGAGPGRRDGLPA